MTDHEGKKGFLILLEETENGDKVVKQSLVTDLESRLSTLEFNIEVQNSFFFKISAF
jgi:hypothetical protein